MDLVVPNYQEALPETYPSGSSIFGGWSMNSPEATEKCYDYNSFCSASTLDDFDGIDQMDDMFLNSILEDVPGTDCASSGNNNNSFGSSSMYGGTGSDVPTVFVSSDLSEENMLDSHYVDELSSEELVLQDLQRASKMLTDETRKCFRDTFYRLARNSNEKSDSVSNNNSYDYCGLSGGKETESEANTIDRAVANLTFNKMEFNITNFPLTERVQ